MIERARRYAPRPYEIVVLSDHGQTQGATFRQRNGYGLDELVQRSLAAGASTAVAAGDENETGVAAGDRRGDRPHGPRRGRAASRERRRRTGEAVVLGSGNLGLDLPHGAPDRLTLEEIARPPPRADRRRCARTRTSAFVLVRSAADGAVALGGGGDAPARRRPRRRDRTRWPASRRTRPRHLRRTDGFPHVADIIVNSFYDPVTEEGCAFEELISFHGGMGGPQTRPFVLHPAHLPAPDEPLVGAEAVHRLLRAWRDGRAATRASAGARSARGRRARAEA